VLAELERSGASLAAFARREGLSAERLYRWRARLTKTRATFVEIRPDVVVSATGGVLEVVLAGGRAVRVPSDFDEVALRRLIAVLEGAC
jgi:transposase-like protein